MDSFRVSEGNFNLFVFPTSYSDIKGEIVQVKVGEVRDMVYPRFCFDNGSIEGIEGAEMANSRERSKEGDEYFCSFAGE